MLKQSFLVQRLNPIIEIRFLISDLLLIIFLLLKLVPLLISSPQILALNEQYLVFEQKHLFKGLNKPVLLKFFSIISEIFSPNSFTFTPLNSSDLISTCRGETAIGSGSRFPRVISTSINAKDLLIKIYLIRL